MPPARPSLLGQTFGRLTVVAEAGYRKSGSQRVSCWKVRCECGREKVLTGNSLRRTESCGCGRRRPEPPAGKGWCRTCRRFRELDDFYSLRSGPQGHYPQCKKCYRDYVESKRPRIRTTRRKWERRVREEAVAHYGKECACCGEEQLEFLNVEPVRNRGRKKTTAWWLKKNGYPKGFRVYCFNCTTARGLYGHCPHERQIVLGR